MTAPQRPQLDAQDQFGRLARAYRESKTHSQANALASAADFLSDRRYGLAVDVGAGPGFTAFAVAHRCDRVVAADVTPEMLEQARALREERGAANVETLLAAAESLPFDDASVDLVTCRTAAHHFLDPEAWLAETARVLAPDGELILIDTVSPDDPEAAAWMHEIEVWRDPSHARNLTAGEWADAIARAGLRVDAEAASRVELEYPDWTQRAGMEDAEAERLGEALRAAPPAAASAFRIAPHPDGRIAFSWPVVTMRAAKPSAKGEPTL